MSLPALAVVALFLLSSASQAEPGGEAPGLSAFRAEYSLSRNDIPFGKVELALELDAGRVYRYHAHTVPTGLASVFREDEITEYSSGLIEPRRIRPEQYRYTRKDAHSSRFTELDFDWERLQVTNRSDGSRWSMAIPQGTQDKLGLQLMVMLDLARGYRSASYPVADGGKLKRYAFELTDTRTIETPFGPLETLRIRRSKQDKAPDAVFWFAPALNYLPVRIDRTRNDARYRMQLERLEGLSPTPLTRDTRKAEAD